MKKYLPFIAALIAAAIMMQTLYFKFTAQSESVILFTKLNMEPDGRILIGILELIASLLILIPKTRFVGAFLGLGLMSGAIFFHLTIIGIESNQDGGMLFLLAITAWLCCFYLSFKPVVKIAKSILKKRSNTAILIGMGLISITSSKSLAQGCSDAGFCSVGELKSELSDSTEYKNKIGLTPVIGIGEDKTFIFTPTLQYDRQLNKKWSIQTKFTVNYANGNLGSTFGLGDVIQSCSYNIQSNRKIKVSFTAGVKVPLSNSNQKAAGRSLPMTYQSSLGTLDAIAGIGLKFHQFKAAFGLQAPLTNLYSKNGTRSANGFLRSEWDSIQANPYPSTNGFVRAADVLFKIEYNWKLSQKFALTPGLLSIYHLIKDKYQETKGDETFRSIQDSEGLTINFTLVAAYQITKRLKTSLTFGVPLVVRTVRPDGLTRRFVLGPEISYQF
ncbi:DoxX family protein [Fluviicola taffensis]|uniref:DoxX family protein n=1 Tax=Fluviicola taffensis TaxID=191579 RepID=UPI0031377EEB